MGKVSLQGPGRLGRKELSPGNAEAMPGQATHHTPGGPYFLEASRGRAFHADLVARSYQTRI
jgi:hypothetical protein